MFQTPATQRSRFTSRSNRRSNRERRPFLRSRRLGLEALESREMLSATDMTFHVLNDATANISYQYAADGTPQGSTSLVAANAAPRGAASTVASDKTWVIDANRNVYVYDASGGLLGSWSAGSMANNATPEGIATNGTDIWIVDGRSDKVYRYAGAASRLSGSQNASSSFSLSSSNANPKDLVSDGASLWVVNDTTKTDKVFKYAVTGSFVGSWTIDSANKTPTGIALDPADVGDLWIADSGTDRVYKYTAAASRDSGSQAAASSFALATGNTNPQGIVVPGRPWAEAPYQVSWVRQLGSAGDDFGRGVSADELGNVFLSGWTNGSLAAPNPTAENSPFLARYDSDGNHDWVQQEAPGAEGVRVATDGQGNVFAPRRGSMNKYDATGALLWTTPTQSETTIYGVTVDELGKVYGATADPTFDTVVVRKFDGQTGSILWERTFNTGGGTNTSGISADRMGSVYVLGHTIGSVLGPNAGPQDVFIVKYSDAGDFHWARQFGTTGTELAFNINADGFGNVYAGGSTSGSWGGPNAGSDDLFVSKFDAAGNLQWTRQWGNSSSEVSGSVWTDSSGNVFVTGKTDGSLGGPNLGGSDLVVAKFDSTGNLLWRTQLGTSGIEINSGGMSGDDQGNIYIAGRTSGSWDGPNAGVFDAVLIKLSPPAASASGSSLSSLGVATALMGSDDSLASATATSVTTSNDVAALSESKIAGERSAAKKHKNFVAREQVFASLMSDRNDVLAKRVLKASRFDHQDQENRVAHTGDEGATFNTALDAVFASVR